ncbi:MAG: M20/M25/M40 family metallo-hydrolase [Chitinophagaceae bacterium]
MKKMLFAALLCWQSTSLSAQTIIQRDPEIEKMVSEVSSDSLESYVRRLVSFGTRNTLSLANNPVRGIGAARNWVLKRFQEFGQQAQGRFTAYIDSTILPADGRRVDKPTVLGNVMGILKGSDPADPRVFLMSAHLDNMRSSVMDRDGDAPGANDDASGVAAVMETARIMCKRNFPATVIFIAFSGEEQGLLGAQYLAGRAQKEKWQIEAMLNNDIMGSNNSNETKVMNNTQVRIFSEAYSLSDTGRQFQQIRALGLENDGKARQLARYIKEIGERYVDHLQIKMIYRNDRFLRGGDHTPFVAQGYAAVRITEMNENYYHQHQDVRMEKGIQYGDLPEFMDFEYLRRNTAMNLSCLANLAKAPAQPDAVTIQTRRLTNYSTLSWKAPQYRAAAGYYLLMRETTSPHWERKIFTKDTEITIPYSKDNYFFAVQAVSADGNESLPVVPMPAGR